MNDCRGKLLRAGDFVSVAWSQGHTIGRLVYDPDDIRYKTLRVEEESGYVRFTQKKSSRVLSLTAMMQEELDSPTLSVLH